MAEEKNQNIVISVIDKEWCEDCLLPKGNGKICACIVAGWIPKTDEKINKG